MKNEFVPSTEKQMLRILYDVLSYVENQIDLQDECFQGELTCAHYLIHEILKDYRDFHEYKYRYRLKR